MNRNYRPSFIKRISVDFESFTVKGEWKDLWHDAYHSAFLDLTESAIALADKHELATVSDGFVLALLDFLDADLHATVNIKLRYAKSSAVKSLSPKTRVARFRAAHATPPLHGRFVISLSGENRRRCYVYSVDARNVFYRFTATKSKQSAYVYADRRVAEMDSVLYQLSKSDPRIVRAAKPTSRLGMPA